MRLLQQNENGDLSFTDNTYNPPPYAILSHTWGSPNDEVLYDDIMNGTWREKDAHVKLNFISERAKRERLQHFWVDTCCIDKRNDAELSTAIRSMFQWYKDSAVCFVYLSDISSSKRNEDGQLLWRENLRFCRWFTRGWTLQELVAPIRVEFFARGQYLGCRADLSERIHEITGIDVEALRGRPLEKFPLFTRRQWALGRETSVPEDSAYALMGLCGVVLVPHYGGESKEEALRRLDRKIRKHWGENALDRPASAVASDYISDYTAPNSKSVATRRRAKIAALGFDAIDSRKTTIKKAQWRTCSWVLTHQTYKLWQERSIAQPHNGIFWIRGKPGAGKSVLMKYIDTHTSRTKNQRDISISFYFNARGERLEQSLDGMYRSLLRQLLLADPELQEVLDHSREITGESSSTTTELKRLFSGAVLRLTGRRLFCFIDALDECREQDLQDMVYYFQELWKEAQEEGIIFSVCFASRYYPSLDVPTELQIILEHVDEHKNDLSEYVKSQKFSVGMGGLESIPLGIQEQILEKANGVFLLAVLAVEVLKEEFKSGRIHVIRKRLDEMPRGLSEFFQEIVQRDQQNTEEFLLCLKWILFAKQPLTLEQFYFAMMAGLAGESLESKSDLTADTMLSYLLSSSKGLAELTQGTRPRVQFIHESVRNFLITQDGLVHLEESYGISGSSPQETLKKCCIRGIQVDASAWTRRGRNSINGRDRLHETFPFLDYANQNILHHADKAVQHSEQKEFLESFDVKSWAEQANVLTLSSKRYSHTPSIVYVCAEKNCAALLGLLAKNGCLATHDDDQLYEHPLFAAFVNHSRDAAYVLLEQEGTSCPEVIVEEVMSRIHCGHRVFERPGEQSAWLSWALNNGLEAFALHCSKMYPIPTGEDRVSVLTAASLKGYEMVVSMLLERLKGDTQSLATIDGLVAASANGHEKVVAMLLQLQTDSRAEHQSNSLAMAVAAYNGHEKVVAMLLERGANENAECLKDRSVVFNAARKGHDTIVAMLLERGADANAQGRIADIWGSSLYAAALHGHEKVVTVLLNAGANVNGIGAIGGMNGSALYAAAQSGHDKVVSILLAHGAQIDLQYDWCGNALAAASHWGCDKIVAMLLNKGADANASCRYYKNALLAASASGHIRTATILIEKGANINGPSGYYGNPLTTASYLGHAKLVAMLLRRGADVHLRSGVFGSALSAALQGDHHNVAVMLCDWGAGESGSEDYSEGSETSVSDHSSTTEAEG